MKVKTRKGVVEFTVDEHPRPKTTMEQISKLPPVFLKDGTVHAGNASVRERDELLFAFLKLKITDIYFIFKMTW